MKPIDFGEPLAFHLMKAGEIFQSTTTLIRDKVSRKLLTEFTLNLLQIFLSTFMLLRQRTILILMMPFSLVAPSGKTSLYSLQTSLCSFRAKLFIFWFNEQMHPLGAALK